jgi:hypothetical protein
MASHISRRNARQTAKPLRRIGRCHAIPQLLVW